MLPSTFTTPAQRQEKMKKNKLKVKLEYTKLLQETLDELGPISKGLKLYFKTLFYNIKVIKKYYFQNTRQIIFLAQLMQPIRSLQNTKM